MTYKYKYIEVRELPGGMYSRVSRRIDIGLLNKKGINKKQDEIDEEIDETTHTTVIVSCNIERLCYL